MLYVTTDKHYMALTAPTSHIIREIRYMDSLAIAEKEMGIAGRSGMMSAEAFVRLQGRI